MSAWHIRRPPDSLPASAPPADQADRDRADQDRVRQSAGRGLAWWLPPMVFAAALVALGSAIGLWYLPFAAGVLLGVATRLARFGRAVSVTGLLLLGPVGWGAALAAMSWHGAAIGATARIAAAIAGLPPLAALTVALTLLIALVQAAAGLWLGRAFTPRRSREWKVSDKAR
jgi:hypothetical protein